MPGRERHRRKVVAAVTVVSCCRPSSSDKVSPTPDEEHGDVGGNGRQRARHLSPSSCRMSPPEVTICTLDMKLSIMYYRVNKKEHIVKQSIFGFFAIAEEDSDPW